MNLAELSERVTRLEADQNHMTQVLRKLGDEMDKLSGAVVELKITIARVIGIAMVAMPVLTYFLPKVMNHIWP